MADSESDDAEDQTWKKGEKRRQEDNEEESDEDLSSEEHSDASDESFDENMVCTFACKLSLGLVFKSRVNLSLICLICFFFVSDFCRKFLSSSKLFLQGKKISMG